MKYLIVLALILSSGFSFAEESKEAATSTDNTDNSEFLDTDSEALEDLAEEEETYEFTFMHAKHYGAFSDSFYNVAIYLSTGFQLANVEEDFNTSNESATTPIPLPEDYSLRGMIFEYHPFRSKLFFGLRLDSLSATDDRDTIKISYNLSLGTLFFGLKLMDTDVVNIAPHVGLVSALSGSAKTTSVVSSEATSTESDFSIGLSYSYGIQTIIKFAWLHVGFDAGYLVLNDQKIDDEDFSSNTGGYVKGILGAAL